MGKFYVYEHWRPDTDLCFWVGKGKGGRAYIFKRNGHYDRIVHKLKKLGMCVEVRMVQSGLEETAAFDLEVGRILFWKKAGIKLANKTNGGEGPSGHRLSEIHKAKLLAANTGRKVSTETREKIRESLRGQEFSEDRRAKISAANRGRNLTSEHKEKLSRAQKRFMESPDARAHVSATSTGRTHSDATRKMFSTIHKGKIVSEETKSKIREARKHQVIEHSPETRKKIGSANRRRHLLKIGMVE